ncbi:hypothetical protein [Pedobacter sp. NJ-S-72]
MTIHHSNSGVKKIRLQPVSDQIIHVTEISDHDFGIDNSLMAIKQNNPDLKFSVKETEKGVILTTATLSVETSLETGLLTYYTIQGDLLLAQSKKTVVSLVPKVFSGEPCYQVTQLFDAQKDEAYYGLGQHQQGVMNYRGRRVDLVQYNTDIAVPFFLSNKGYGVLWIIIR